MASKFDRIATDLRRKIETGELKPGDQLPSETKLLGQYDVSLVTLRRGLDQLAAEALIEKRQGIGNFVRAPKPFVRREAAARYQWEKDRALLPEEERLTTGATEHDTGLTVKDLVFHANYASVPASADLAELFSISEGTQLLRREYLTRPGGDNTPFGLSRSYLVHSTIAANPDLLDPSNEPWPGGTQHQLYTIGVEVDYIVDELTARPPTSDEAEALHIDTGVSVIVLRKISHDVRDNVVEVADVLMPGDRTKLVYKTQLKPWPAKRKGRK